eukprot:8527755-Pyramimonas_sp.AAC.1
MTSGLLRWRPCSTRSLTSADVARGASVYSKGTAVGVDQWAPRALLDLPERASAVFADMSSKCELAMMWPAQ